jgi:hypothetical protein
MTLSWPFSRRDKLRPQDGEDALSYGIALCWQ